MTNAPIRRLIVALIAASSVSTFAIAQKTSAPLETVGSASISKTATTMRVVVALKAQGKTLKEASTALTEKSEAIEIELKALKATEVVTGNISIDTAAATAHRQMVEAMSYEGGGDLLKGMESRTMLQQFLRAEWKLTSSGLKLLEEVDKLQTSVGKINFETETSEMSAEEQELLEEAAMFRDDDDGGKTRPVFLFLAEISPEERAEAAKQAFKKAQKAADELAAAAMLKRGPLLTLRHDFSQDSGSTDYGDYELMQAYGESGYRALQKMGGVSDESVVWSQTPGDLTYTVSIRAGFEFAAE